MRSSRRIWVECDREHFYKKPVVPDTVKHLDADIVIEVLSRHSINVSEAAAELGVASADLRRLLWARPHLVDARRRSRSGRRGWITTPSASVDMNIGTNAPPQRIIISWGNPDGTIEGDDEADDGKTIEHESGPTCEQ